MVVGVLDILSFVEIIDVIDCEVDKEFKKFDTIVGDINLVVVWSVWFFFIIIVVMLYLCIDVDNNRLLFWLFYDVIEDCKDFDKEGIIVDCLFVVGIDIVERETLFVLVDKDIEID